MKFPYGVSDFYQMVTEGYFYVDRTDRIPLLESLGKQLVFLRPRRFGKSLLLSMLENYYDVAKAYRFERVFGQLAIARAPTPLHNRYFVLKWDFSVVAAYGDADAIVRSLHEYLNSRIQDFAVYYRELLPTAIDLHPTNALVSFQSLLTAVRETPYRLYLLIDEYDNFANEIVMSAQAGGRGRYEALLHGEGALKTVFKAIKAASAGAGLDRVFITGVSPVVLSDLTSGYNVARSIAAQPVLHDLCGFTEPEIAAVLRDIVISCQLPPERGDEALITMRTFYNGYRFSVEVEQPVYNSTLALYFLQEFQERCRCPANMLDSNLAMDRNRLVYISRLPGGSQLILDAVNGEPPVAVGALADRFGVVDMLREDQEANFNASLLYFLGVLTLGGATPTGKLILTIPNLVVRRLYVEQARELLLPSGRTVDEGRQAAERLYQEGDLGPLCEFIEQRYFRVFDNRDYRWADELTVKTAFLTLLFNDMAYIMDSEPVLERTYADLVMIVRPDMRQYQLLDILLEFKFVALPEAKLTGEQAQGLSVAELRALPVVQRKQADARSKLQSYRQALQTRYGDQLRLRAYAVVALGFERLVWMEV
ncbi:MAG: AAA family ATPase [Chloroflexi bacterium]|nr:AAA family ATPase [Chloroflexota bacterium]